jgi:hypothetical protein
MMDSCIAGPRRKRKPHRCPSKGLAHRDRHPATRHILVLHHKDIADTIKQRGKQAFCKWAQEMGAYANTFGRTVPSAAGNPYSRGRRERVPLWNLLPVSLGQHAHHARPCQAKTGPGGTRFLIVWAEVFKFRRGAQTVSGWSHAREGRLPARQVGKKWLVHRDTLETFIHCWVRRKACLTGDAG